MTLEQVYAEAEKIRDRKMESTVYATKRQWTGLRDRIATQLANAQIECRRVQLGELQHLLNEHHDVARILELLELTGIR